ncbi:hypothetical protein NDU88_000819 [Pleurodeles waltl]|uniref:Poly [ADP-ribose] polymerase n=1 Tax=Pleurodeles waltl TaxID=8319 RepID=A0AAV7P2E4_PLEWA|nr:hypothetical protein NDU88_000819 [Pleurodeles waltl]
MEDILTQAELNFIQGTDETAESCWARSAPSYRSFLGFSSTCPLPPGKKLYPAIVLILDVLKTFCDFSVLSIPTETIHMNPPTVTHNTKFTVATRSGSYKSLPFFRKQRRWTSGRFGKRSVASTSLSCRFRAGHGVDAGVETPVDQLARPQSEMGYSADSLYFHEQDYIMICDRFLLGECPAGLLCFRHHAPWPYHWQLRLKASKKWVSLGPIAQEHLERHYCNVNTEYVTLLDRDGCSFQMDLQFLSLTTEKYDLARRLCNSSDPSVNPYFPAQWWFYWKEFGEWRHYEESLSEQLNLAFELGAWTHAFETNGCLYCVCMKGLTQRNVKTGFSRDVRRRPIYRSYESMAPYLRTVMEKDPGTIPDYTGLYPPTWQMEPWTPDSTFLQVPLRRTEKEFIDIKSHFHQTMPKDLVLICRIYRIQNKFLWRKYTCQKELMSEGLNDAEKTSLERHLFHGTTRDVVEQICQQNFDPRLSGVHGTSYGKGSYFALEASYSHNYSRLSEKGYQNMFVAKVLIGKMALGDAKYSRPPKLPSSHALYDCCVDNLLNPKIFVVYDSCQCYPFFLIQYKLLSEPILVNE